MDQEKRGPDPLSVDELIRQGRVFQTAWRLPKPTARLSRRDLRDWQQLMDERLVKSTSWGA